MPPAHPTAPPATSEEAKSTECGPSAGTIDRGRGRAAPAIAPITCGWTLVVLGDRSVMSKSGLLAAGSIVVALPVLIVLLDLLRLVGSGPTLDSTT